jgi:dolichol-phosphate mannosyltransferase
VGWGVSNLFALLRWNQFTSGELSNRTNSHWKCRRNNLLTIATHHFDMDSVTPAQKTTSTSSSETRNMSFKSLTSENSTQIVDDLGQQYPCPSLLQHTPPLHDGERGERRDVLQDIPALKLLSVIIPARDEEGCIASTVAHLHVELALHGVAHEIIVVDDGSSDRTWDILQEQRAKISELRPIRNLGPNGFGLAIICGLDSMRGDAAVIMMADESDDCRDVVRYWEKLNDGFDCIFGSRFSRGGGVIDYPRLKLAVNRLANLFLKVLFRIRLNDTTNAFKAYRKTAIDGCRPLISPHFNMTVELPLKAIVRGYSWTVIQ